MDVCLGGTLALTKAAFEQVFQGPSDVPSSAAPAMGGNRHVSWRYTLNQRPLGHQNHHVAQALH